MSAQDQYARRKVTLRELWVDGETYDALVEEAKSICVIKDPSCTETKICGVLIRRVGDV